MLLCVFEGKAADNVAVHIFDNTFGHIYTKKYKRFCNNSKYKHLLLKGSYVGLLIPLFPLKQCKERSKPVLVSPKASCTTDNAVLLDTSLTKMMKDISILIYIAMHVSLVQEQFLIYKNGLVGGLKVFFWKVIQDACKSEELVKENRCL